MADNTHPLELSVEQLARHCSVEHFSFKTTADLASLREIIGQPRGVQAIEFGIDIFSPGYNIYVMGDRGTGRLTAIERFIQARASDDPVPDDVLYVENFETPHQPIAIQLPAGQGRGFCEAMTTLIEQLQAEINRTFESQTFNENAQKLRNTFQEQRDVLFHQVQASAADKDFSIRTTQQGMVLAPMQNGQPLSPEVYDALPDKERDAIEKRRTALESELAGTLREAAELEDLAKESYDNLVKETIGTVIDEQLAPLRETYADNACIPGYLDALRKDVLEHIEDFVEKTEEEEQMSGLFRGPSPEEARKRYEVNLLVDRHDDTGAPVVVVQLPTYQNLVGRIEHQVNFGAMSTDFTMIKPGALHQANGGFLVVRAMDILRQPFAWEALKRALNTGKLCIEEPESSGTSVTTTQTLEPEPIPFKLKVVMIGSPMLYYMLFENEEDFPELFKVKADFAATMPRDKDTEDRYATFVATRCHEEDLPHFTAAAVGSVVDYGTWLARDQQKISTRFGEITDLVREAAYYARRAERDHVLPEDVTGAIDARRYRSNLYEELSLQHILDNNIIVETEGQTVGQINGLTVLQLGDYSFGQPARITARVYVGQTDVVQIEREVEMTGPIHDKGVLILRGYLGSRYAQDFPLALSASLTFEQNYGGVEGDSASSTELYALLSALSGYPIRQDLAVTGSVDQRGVIQPIGGVTEKIEGFFYICQQRGLTGTQGVMIPQSNVRNLMLNGEVSAAVEAGKFHIYAIESIDQGIELLTGIPAGERQPDGSYPPDSVHYAVQNRLRELAESLRRFTSPTIHVNNEG